MKRTFKVIALCLAVLAFTALFAGCDYIDQLRADHAILSDDKNSIIYKGELYKRLPDVKEEETFYWSSNVRNINVTDKDVPVLLSDSLCHYAGYDPNRDLITLSFAEESTEHLLKGSYGFTIGFDARYCNAEDYEKYTANINNNKADRIGFKYSFYSDYNFYETIEAGGETLSKEVLAHVANNKNMTADTYKEIKNALYSESYSDVMLLCDEYAVNISVLGDENYTIERNKNGEAYLINEVAETAVKLSDEATAQLKNEYFLSSFDSSVDYIGYDDSESDIQ